MMITKYAPVKKEVAYVNGRCRRVVFFRMFLLVSILLCATAVLYAQAKRMNILHTQNTSQARNTITRFFEHQARVRYIYQVAINPDATAIAWCADGPEGSQVINRASLSGRDTALRISAATAMDWCRETEPQWSPDGREIAFLSDARSRGQLQIFIADAGTGQLTREAPLTQFDGFVSHLQWSPDGKRLSVLYVEKASREPSPMAAGNRAVGVIDSNFNRDVQRIAVIDRQTGNTEQATPPGLYVYEYDWSPDGKRFVYTAALPPGDANWYIAGLYKQSVAEFDTVLLYKPMRQIALPRWSPDSKRIAFIEGLMSDQGGIGGEIFFLPSSGNGTPHNLTPQRPSTPAWFTWRADGSMLFTEFVGGSVAVNTLNTTTGAVRNLWKADASMRAGSEELSLAVGGSVASPVAALTYSTWNKLPEVYAGRFDALMQVTQLNKDLKEPRPKAENIVWKNEGWPVQGWLLYPHNYDSSKRYPMLVCVHGGPAWITTPTWSAPDFNTTVYTQLGYFVFFPNPRGSHGQGLAFTLANRRDWGGGDLRDILTGIDGVLKKFPVDSTRIGILGWSYGGAMSMFATTQTNRFRAAVAGAGAADWKSYYGQNRIDKWMGSYFGASPYDDPYAYEKSSAMTYIKQAKTPTLLLVGERDGEAPPPQSFQFWHALKELQVPTQLVVYADEGHAFESFENMIDVSVRTIEWFDAYMGF